MPEKPEFCFTCGENVTGTGHMEKVYRTFRTFCTDHCPSCNPKEGYKIDPSRPEDGWVKANELKGEGERHDGAEGDGKADSDADSDGNRDGDGGGNADGDDGDADAEGGDGEGGDGEGEGGEGEGGEGELTNTHRAMAALRAVRAYVQTDDFNPADDPKLAEAVIRGLASDLMHLADRTTSANRVRRYGRFGQAVNMHDEEVEACEEGDWKVLQA